MPRKKSKIKPVEEQDNKTGRGHPIDYETVDWKPVQCAKCGSANRRNFQGNVRKIDGFGVRTHEEFGKYNQIILRPTKCLDCDQWLMSREYRMDTSKP